MEAASETRELAEIDDASRRARRYIFADGLIEVAAGTFALVVGLLDFVRGSTSLTEPLSAVLAATQVVAVVGGTLLTQRVVTTAKMRLVYPRTGIVTYRTKSRPRRIIGGIAAGLGGATLLGIARQLPPPFASVQLVEGIVVAVGLFALGYQLDVRRLEALALASVLFGLGAALAVPDETIGSALYFCAFGVALLASGSLALRAYLRQTTVEA